jgi:hypothetical protein
MSDDYVNIELRLPEELLPPLRLLARRSGQPLEAVIAVVLAQQVPPQPEPPQ